MSRREEREAERAADRAAGFPGAPGAAAPFRPEVGGEAIPGKGGAEFEFAGPGGAGGATTPVAPNRDTPLSTVTSFLDLLVAGDLETAAQLVSPRATGLLAKIREQTIAKDDPKLEALVGAATGRTQIGRERNRGRTLQYSFLGGNKVILIEADQNDEGCSVMKVELRNAPRSRRSS